MGSSEDRTKGALPASLLVPGAIGLVFLGCCTNVVFLELIIKDDPGTGNIITFFQFLFIAIEGFFMQSQCLQKSPSIPIRSYMMMVAFYFTVSTINNYAFNFKVPVPLHIIFRAGSLMANLIMGVIILRRRYSLSKYIAVIMITVGISAATLASTDQINDSFESDPDSDEVDQYQVFRLGIGIAMLVFALFASAGMGIFQELLYKKHGKHPREAMFYTHALPLPGFLLLATDIWGKILVFNASEPIMVGGLPIPKLWLYMLGNCITQYVCIRGVFILTTECPSLVVTLVVTLRKFVSLLFSIYYFQNPFTLQHWMATGLVFTGTALFTGLLNPVINLITPPQTDKTKKD